MSADSPLTCVKLRRVERTWTRVALVKRSVSSVLGCRYYYGGDKKSKPKLLSAGQRSIFTDKVQQESRPQDALERVSGEQENQYEYTRICLNVFLKYNEYTLDLCPDIFIILVL